MKNIVTIYEYPNKSTMKKLENDTRRAVDAGETIVYNVIPEYRKDENIPAGITIIATGDKGFSRNVSIINSPMP